MVDVLEVDAAGQRRDVAVATTMLPGMAAEMGGEGEGFRSIENKKNSYEDE
jgi:hypothetical protein